MIVRQNNKISNNTRSDMLNFFTVSCLSDKAAACFFSCTVSVVSDSRISSRLTSSASASFRPFSFFIDEAELHLHPSAQRNLKNLLFDLSKSSDQVFINTHSSVLIADNSEVQSIFSVEKEDGTTGIE